MSDERPSKRLRAAPDTGGYHDSVPFGDGYNVVHSRDVVSRRVGSTTHSAHTERLAQPDTSWDSTVSWAPFDDPDYLLDLDGEGYDQALDADVMDDLPVQPSPLLPKKKKQSRVSKRPHVVWKELNRQAYLDEMIRWSGRADFRTAKECPDCVARGKQIGLPEYRCRECFIADLAKYMLTVLQKWNGDMFVPVSLKSMGLKIQLNHASLFCDNPIPAHASFLILHTNGIHAASVMYCGCARAIANHLQLLRRGFYPASQLIVKTCATFEVLELLHKLALTTKASTYDFYRALEKMTVNTGLSVPKNRYRQLMRMNLQWRHLKMLKWGGRGHDPSGAAGTKDGELAVACPSCPRPGVNLPVGWETQAEATSYLYRMFICMDANFRLKNQQVSNYSQDPGLGVGLAYMLPRVPYEPYVVSRANDADISTCVGLQALAKAVTMFSKGLRHTGVGGAFCGRSEMILPGAIGNLQKGERYANMDYVFGSALQGTTLPSILVSYDIACQWFINLFDRMDNHWPRNIRLGPATTLIPAIPKLHEPMHGTKNHEVYSLNFIPGVGFSDFETPERVWSAHNALGNSTKTQGPGSRQDVLDDHFGFWNWLKYVGLGKTLMRRYKLAVGQRNIHIEGHRGLTACMDPEQVELWEAVCLTWEADTFPKKAQNPYRTPGSTISTARVKKDLADEEEARLAGGGISHHATSASAFVELGLYLEEMQVRIRRQAKKSATHSTLYKDGSLTEQRNLLRTRLRGWERLVPIYMPGVLQYRIDGGTSTSLPPPSPASAHPEDAEIWLPSHIPAPDRDGVCMAGLPGMETRLREAQAYDALEKVRNTLKIKSRMILFKNKNVRGQREGTKSMTVIEGIHEKARLAAERYRRARVAKMALSGPGDWELTLRVLQNGDVRGYQDANQLRERQGRRGTLDDEQLERAATASSASNVLADDIDSLTLLNQPRERRDGTGETRCTLSWIWTSTSNIQSPEDSSDDILRAEWAKSRARAARGTEEVLLLREEMRRVVEFLSWKAAWWNGRRDWRTVETKELAEGLRAYAYTQADLQTALSTEFRIIWKAPLDDAIQGEGLTVADEGLETSDSEESSGDEQEVNDDPDDDPDDDDMPAV